MAPLQLLLYKNYPLKRKVLSLQEQVSKEPAAFPAPTDYRPNSIGEEAFEADAGEPLGDTIDNISDVLHSSDDLVEIRDLDCRQSVCKITYTASIGDPSSMGRNSEGDNVLIDRLTDGAPGADFDISHARDDQGNSVMYSQLR